MPFANVWSVICFLYFLHSMYGFCCKSEYQVIVKMSTQLEIRSGDPAVFGPKMQFKNCELWLLCFIVTELNPQFIFWIRYFVKLL